MQETQEHLTTTKQEFLNSTNKSKRKLAAVRVEKIEKALDAQLEELEGPKASYEKRQKLEQNCYNWKPAGRQR